MIFGSFLIVLIFISMSNALMGGKGGTTGDAKGIRRGNWVIFFMFLAPFGLLVASLFGLTFLIIYLSTITTLLLSGYLADISAFFGWVRPAYYLGQLNVFSLKRNPKSLDLYRGYKAASRLPDQDERREALHWLHSQCHKQTGKLFSGQMIMFVIIEAQLTRAGDHQYLAQRLNLLRHTAKTSIPGPISLLASKFALAPALADNDWNSIRSICEQWNTPADNYLVKYLREFHGLHMSTGRYFSRFRCWRYSLRLFSQPEVLHFAKQSLKDSQEEKQNGTVKGLLALSPGHLSQDLIEKIRDELTNETAQSQWMKRAEELGIKNFTTSWEQILKSLKQCKKLKQASDVIEDEDEYFQLEQHHKKLIYVRSSIEEKLVRVANGPTLPHFLDWLQVLDVLIKLKDSKHNQLQAFDSIHPVIWDWVADLWNIRKDRCLAHYIASECHSLAIDIGNKEFAQVLSGIKSGKFR